MPRFFIRYALELRCRDQVAEKVSVSLLYQIWPKLLSGLRGALRDTLWEDL